MTPECLEISSLKDGFERNGSEVSYFELCSLFSCTADNDGMTSPFRLNVPCRFFFDISSCCLPLNNANLNNT